MILTLRQVAPTSEKLVETVEGILEGMTIARADGHEERGEH